jgi:hypothetical protein
MSEQDLSMEAGLRRALALDEEELAFLRAAALPQRLAAQILAAPQPRMSALDLLWIALPATVGYVAWLFAAPVLAAWLAVARQAGLSSLVATLLANAAWRTVDLFASMVEAASSLPGFDAPLVAISLLAAAAYVFTVLTNPTNPTKGTPLVRRRTAAV